MADHTAEADFEPIDLDDVSGTRKGHRTEYDCWDYFKKIKLSEADRIKLHRNYNGKCKSCGNTRAEVGSNTEDYDIDNMISYD